MTAPRTRSAAPSEALLARFDAALHRLWPEQGKLGLAVSGGSDSLALLLLAHEAIPGRFEVATVDHGLRPEAAEECRLVGRVCAARGIPCETLKVSVPAGNVQAEAREVRYGALVNWARERQLSAIATAHHADDQAETLLMRLNRASGHAGLAGVRERGVVTGSEVPLIRPLLGFHRHELAGVVEAAGLHAAQDPSNANRHYDRVRVRDALAEADWLDPSALAASAAHLAEGEEALAWAAEREWLEAVTESPGELRYRRTAPRAIALRVVSRAIAALGQEPRGQDAARLLGRLEEGGCGNIGGVMARVKGGVWLFRREPPRRTG